MSEPSSNPAAHYREFLSHGGAIDLSARTQLRLTGVDRVRYLNGQVTSDIRKLAVGETQKACVTTAKGKLCADVCITATDDALLVDAEAALQEALSARLEHYVVADDVLIEDRTGAAALWHVISAERIAAPPGIAVASSSRFGRPGWDLRGEPAEMNARLDDFLSGRPRLDPALVETIRIEAGVPRWGFELNEDTLPPEAGLDATHIDYHKGCYIGQEVISRLRSVGHVNRALTGFVAEAADVEIAPGWQLFAEETDGPPVGSLTSVAFSFTLERPIALGYLKRGSPTGALHARPAGASGPHACVTVRELPFVS